MTAKKSRAQPAGPKALTGSDEARRRATVILEAMCGLRTTQSASDELRIALVRYYVLETRMLQAMIDALEPRARGRKRDLETELEQVRGEAKRAQRELLRLQALHRVTQRAVCIKPDKAEKPAKSKGGATVKKRRTRKQSRGERVLAAMKATDSAAQATPLPAPSATVTRSPDEGVA